MKAFFLLLLVSFLQLMITTCSSAPLDPDAVVQGSWDYYKRAFIIDGRVVRPKNDYDTVSEGESYAMLRAVLMGDRKTFDECLEWTESFLSRKTLSGDHLLAWHFKNGRISDKTAASDADIDYAFSLILASQKWNETRYLELAREVMQSILDHETVELNGRLYLLPATEMEPATNGLIAQNPSYYAPSSFKVFYEVSGDKRWIRLADTAYNLVRRLQKSREGVNANGLVPDWCALDENGDIKPLPDKSNLFGWDAVRVPLRMMADYQLNHDHRALEVLRRFSLFFESEFNRNGRILSEYSCENGTGKPYESPLFYTAAYTATEAAGSSVASAILQRQREYIVQNGNDFFYGDSDDYYVNSLAWLVEYYQINKTSREP